MLDPIFVRGKGEPSLQSATKSSRKGRFRLGLPKTYFSDVISPRWNSCLSEHFGFFKNQVAI